MSRLTSNLLVGFAALLLVGAGWYLVAKNRLETKIAVTNAAQERELAQLRAAAGRLKDRLAAGNVPAPSAPASHLPARVHLAVDLINSGLLGQFRWPNPTLNSLAAGMSELADFLGLSASETAALQQATETGSQAFGAALLAHAAVKRNGSMVSITVANEPDVHAAYDRMQESIAAVLGPGRQSYYESLGAKSAVQSLFARWGLGGTTLMVAHATAIPDAFYSHLPDGSGTLRESLLARPRGASSGRLLYYYTQIKPGPTGGVSGTDTIEHVGANVGPLHALIPPDL